MGMFKSWSRLSTRNGWVLVVLGVLGTSGTSLKAQDPNGPEVLAQGPIHEAFAAPVVFNPTPGVVVPKAPPTSQVEEQPPDQKPQGSNVDWIPGYWAWDDQRGDYLWVSGIWRDIPPGRQWVPGYWGQADSGYRWTSGFWSPTAANGQLNYLPTPPQSLEAGPNTPQPGQDWFWSPGSWVWNESRFIWRPGYWVQSHPEWIWVPPSYAATPSGYVYIDGYWDYPVARRGLPYAPVYFNAGFVAQPAFAYTPSIVLSVGGITANLFVRPSYGAYYFGNYYAGVGGGGVGVGVGVGLGGGVSIGVGFVPWFSYQQQRFGYEPLYASMAAQNWRNPQWARQIRTDYQFRVEHIEARPAATFAAQRAQLERARAEGRDIRGMELAHPLNQSLEHPGEVHRMVAVPAHQRAEIAQRQAAVREVTQTRARVEGAARASASARAADHRPQQLQIPRAPQTASAEPRSQNQALKSPPAHPEGHQSFRPTMQGQAHREPAAGQQHGDPRKAQNTRAAHNEPKNNETEEHPKPR
jgi:hypothetical protein